MDSKNETMMLEYETRKEQDPTFTLTLGEFAVLWRAREKPKTIVCEHGSLKRQCLVCELQEDKQTLQEIIDGAMKDLTKVRTDLQAAKADIEEINARIDYLCTWPATRIAELHDAASWAEAVGQWCVEARKEQGE